MSGQSILKSDANATAFTELVACLEEMVKVYRALLEVVRKEKEILIESRIDELNENNKVKDGLLVRVRTLENTRMKLARDLAIATHTDIDQPRLLEIAAEIDGAEGDRLRNLHSVLDLLIRRVAELNKANEELVQSALKTITGAMDALRDGLQPKATYERQGSMATGRSEGQLVSREA